VNVNGSWLATRGNDSDGERVNLEDVLVGVFTRIVVAEWVLTFLSEPEE
jgi:hypothetical protein